MIAIYVTGGIGSGKSTLMRFFERQGAALVYADEIGHANLKKADCKAELVAAFGEDILDGDGEIIRGALAARAFATPEATARMDAITQPRLYAGCLEAIAKAGATHKLVVMEMAILDGRDDFYKNADLVIAVTTSPEVRVRRLMESRGFTEEDARNRLARQVPEERRLAIADVVFTNDGSIEEFEQELNSWWQAYVVPRLQGSH